DCLRPSRARCVKGTYHDTSVPSSRYEGRMLVASTAIPAASPWRTPPSRPRAWARSRCVGVPGLRDARRPDRRGVHLHEAADNNAIGEHVVIVIVPSAGATIQH